MNRLLPTACMLALFITSCTIYKDYPIEVYKPGEITVPPSVQNVALVYRNFKYPGDTLQHFYKNNHRLVKANKDPENLDSILVNTCFLQLAKSLKNNKTFSEIQFFPFNTFEPHVSEKIPELSSSSVEKLADISGAGWIISLETLSWFFSTYPESFDFPETNEVVTVAVWSAYDAKEKKIVDRYSKIDTTIWNGYDNEQNYTGSYRLPSRLDALSIACGKAGEDYAKRFHESWETVNRIYSVPPLPDFSEAAYYFEEGKVSTAVDIWKKYTSERNGKLAIKAMYNLALAYEMQDDLETAQNWLARALELAKSYRSKEDMNLIEDYQHIISDRIKELSILNR